MIGKIYKIFNFVSLELREKNFWFNLFIYIKIVCIGYVLVVVFILWSFVLLCMLFIDKNGCFSKKVIKGNGFFIDWFYL